MNCRVRARSDCTNFSPGRGTRLPGRNTAVFDAQRRYSRSCAAIDADSQGLSERYLQGGPVALKETIDQRMAGNVDDDAVYLLEIFLLFVALAALGPLASAARAPSFKLLPIET